MSTRREPQKNRLEQVGERVRQRALTGSEASAVGFTLVVFTMAGAGAGYLLDTNLETSYWIAIGTLLGAIIGFRQMFAITKKLTRESALDDENTFSSHEAEPVSQPHIAKHMPTAEESVKKPAPTRLFSAEIPPPPLASFELKPGEEKSGGSDHTNDEGEAAK